jgi:carboxymethylenebutenolidase
MNDGLYEVTMDVSDERIVARPAGGGEAIGIVLHPDIGGLRPLFAEHCRRLASHGFAVCAIEPFPGRSLPDLAARMEAARDLDDLIQLGLLDDGATHLDDVVRTCVLGFCMGGYYTFKAAATRRYDRAVAFYGMIRTPEQWAGPGHRSPIESAPSVCPTLAIFGSADPWTPAADIDALRAAWAGRDDCEIVVYDGADHGFVHDPDRPAHRPADAADAWRRALEFLRA